MKTNILLLLWLICWGPLFCSAQITLFQKKDQAEAETKSLRYFECMDSSGEFARLVSTGSSTVPASEFALIQSPAFWEPATRRHLPVSEDGFQEWLKTYNRQESYSLRNVKFVEIRKTNADAYIVGTNRAKKMFENIITGKQYTVGVDLEFHWNLSEKFPIDLDKYRDVYSPGRVYINEVIAGKNISAKNNISFSKALTPLVIDDGLINGNAIINFYNHDEDRAPDYYYNGEMKEGLFDGVGLLVEFNAGSIKATRGIFSHGVFQDHSKANGIIQKLLTSQYINRTLGITYIDTFTYVFQKENFYYGKDKSKTFDLQFELSVFSKGDISTAVLSTRNNAFNLDSPLVVVSTDNQIRDYMAQKIYLEKGTPFAGHEFDDSTGYRLGKTEITRRGNCQGVNSVIADETPISVYVRKSKFASWENIGTWKIIEVYPCNRNSYYGINFVNKDRQYMSAGLEEIFLNSIDFYFEETYSHWNAALNAVVNFAKENKK